MKLHGKESKHEYILDTLRHEILTKVFPPETRLPTQSELTQRFQVGSGTITKVLQQLTSEGFITAKPKVGTIVLGKLPHLNNIALALPQAKNPNASWLNAHWSKYYTALANVATALQTELGRPIRILEGFDDPLGEARHDLAELVRTHQVAGVLFAASPHLLRGTPILEEPGVPRVAFMRPEAFQGIDSQICGPERFIDLALDYLASRGRRRIAVLSNPDNVQIQDAPVQRLLAARKMVCPPCWAIAVNLNSPETAQNIMRLMMRPGKSDRPDGLIITNDNLVDDAIAGLVAEGIRVPDDLEVVAHCNFPWPPFKTLPIKRLGLDITALLRCGIDLIDRKRAGKKIPAIVHIDAVWEDDAER